MMRARDAACTVRVRPRGDRPTAPMRDAQFRARGRRDARPRLQIPRARSRRRARPAHPARHGLPQRAQCAGGDRGRLCTSARPSRPRSARWRDLPASSAASRSSARSPASSSSTTTRIIRRRSARRFQRRARPTGSSAGRGRSSRICTTRTRDFADDFGAALAGADVVWLTDVYPAREAPIAGITGEIVVAAAKRARAARVEYVADLKNLPERMRSDLRSGDVVIFMGAGSIETTGRALLAMLGATV